MPWICRGGRAGVSLLRFPSLEEFCISRLQWPPLYYHFEDMREDGEAEQNDLARREYVCMPMSYPPNVNSNSPPPLEAGAVANGGGE